MRRLPLILASTSAAVLLGGTALAAGAPALSSITSSRHEGRPETTEVRHVEPPTTVTMPSAPGDDTRADDPTHVDTTVTDPAPPGPTTPETEHPCPLPPTAAATAREHACEDHPSVTAPGAPDDSAHRGDHRGRGDDSVTTRTSEPTEPAEPTEPTERPGDDGPHGGHPTTTAPAAPTPGPTTAPTTIDDGSHRHGGDTGPHA